MNKADFIAYMNANLPSAMRTLRGEMKDFDAKNGTAMVEYTADQSMCNPNDGVQGGFICGMLDAAMAIAVFGQLGGFAIVATLEIKVNYLEITRMGKLHALSRIVRAGKTVTFLEAELRDSDGKLLATATQTAHVIRKPSD
jgi:uncharacterized protein (TIGR00369 family)